MQFHFSFKQALRDSWSLFTKHLTYFLVLSFVMIVLNLLGKQGGFWSLLVTVAATIWGYVWISSVLAAVDGKVELLTVEAIRGHLPTLMQFWRVFAIGLIVGAIVVLPIGFVIGALWMIYGTAAVVGTAAGFMGGQFNALILIPLFIAVLVPIYLFTRLAFTNLTLVDRHEGIRKTIRYSWNLTKGKVFWTVLLATIIMVALIILGAVSFGIGMAITYPIAMLMMAKLYRGLSSEINRDTAVAPQPIEIESPQE